MAQASSEAVAEPAEAAPENAAAAQAAATMSADALNTITTAITMVVAVAAPPLATAADLGLHLHKATSVKPCKSFAIRAPLAHSISHGQVAMFHTRVVDKVQK